MEKPTPFTGNTGRGRPCRSPTWSPKPQNPALLGRVSQGKSSSERFLSGVGSAPLVVAESVDGPPPETEKEGVNEIAHRNHLEGMRDPSTG